MKKVTNPVLSGYLAFVPPLVDSCTFISLFNINDWNEKQRNGKTKTTHLGM